MSENLLEVRDVRKSFRVPHAGKNKLCALDGISLDLARGETLGLVGESGCGKSTLARTLMMLERPDAGTVRFDGVAVGTDDLVATEAGAVRDRYRLLLATYAQGLVAGAARLTADHVTHREQFRKPIAMFQAVGQQLADIYVVARSLDLSTTAAAWRMSEGLDATEDLGIAGYWVAAEIPATLRTMTHLHGGIGVDVTYPLHRYFSIAKDLARLVGGPDARLDEIADDSDARLDPKGQATDVH
ncbi:ATP-binding cassette domain-containing protein [Mycolicibacterium poriferae]|uniref:ATP-binding cassette domain-containing protein n=1 Tax=Mycolicibacterium poriferae TaxID=39694 RepID=UPI003D2F609F